MGIRCLLYRVFCLQASFVQQRLSVLSKQATTCVLFFAGLVRAAVPGRALQTSNCGGSPRLDTAARELLQQAGPS